jgi:hypothetical protein
MSRIVIPITNSKKLHKSRDFTAGAIKKKLPRYASTAEEPAFSSIYI